MLGFLGPFIAYSPAQIGGPTHALAGRYSGYLSLAAPAAPACSGSSGVSGSAGFCRFCPPTTGARPAPLGVSVSAFHAAARFRAIENGAPTQPRPGGRVFILPGLATPRAQRALRAAQGH